MASTLNFVFYFSKVDAKNFCYWRVQLLAIPTLPLHVTELVVLEALIPNAVANVGTCPLATR